MNIYEKLQQCRVELQGMSLKKSGHNKFSGYDYFELQDFLPAVNNMFAEKKLCSIVSFDSDMAMLTIVNSEAPEEVIHFTSPMSTAELKACHPVQNLGAVQSYERRYLYIAALEITEHDALDPVTGADNGNSKGKGGKPTTPPPPSEPPKELEKGKVQRMAILRKQKGITDAQHKEFVEKAGVSSSKFFSEEQYQKYVKWMESKPDVE